VKGSSGARRVVDARLLDDGLGRHPPGSIMLSKLGEPRLMDVGIAQNEDLDRLTKTGLAVGTPPMSRPSRRAGC